MFCGHLILLRIFYNSPCSLGVIIFALSSNPGVVVEDTFFPFFFGFVLHYLTLSPLMFTTLGPIVQRPISTNPGLNFNSGFYTSMFKSHFRVIFSICFGSIQSSNWRQKELSQIFFLSFQILHQNFHCFLNIVYGTDKENMFDHQELHKMMVISFILITFTFESRVIVFRRN